MVLKVISKKSSHILYGSKMTEAELEAQIKFVENVSAQLKESFLEAFLRIYDWDPVAEWDNIDFIYDIDKKKLEPVAAEEEEEEQGSGAIKL